MCVWLLLRIFFSKNDGPFYYFTTKAPQRYTDIQYPDGAYLVFGREDAGLPEALLAANQEHCIRMPMRDTCRSPVSYTHLTLPTIA